MDKLELQSLFALWLILSSAQLYYFFQFSTNIILIFTNCFLYHVWHGSLHPSSPGQMLPVYFSRNTYEVPRYLSSWGRRFNRKWDISGLYPHITYLLLSVFLMALAMFFVICEHFILLLDSELLDTGLILQVSVFSYGTYFGD